MVPKGLCWRHDAAGTQRLGGGLTQIRDIARPLGERNNKLIGDGIVVGLNGTGDGGDALVTIRPLMAMMEKMGNHVQDVKDLKNAKNVAYVFVTAELGSNGVRNGDKIDVQVHRVKSAKSLDGGTLMLSFLRSSNHEDDRILAIAQGPVTIVDPANPSNGVVKNGADIEPDFFHHYVDTDPRTGRKTFTLVLQDELASFQLAKTVAEIINEEMALPGQNDQNLFTEPTAHAMDPRNVQVLIPESQGDNASQFIARVMSLPIELPDPEACIVVNTRTQTIAITGNVEIAPAIVHVNGLSIQIVNPEPQPSEDRPMVTKSQWSRFDTSGSPGVKITELIKSLDQLNVPSEQKINAIFALERTGALRAKIVREF